MVFGRLKSDHALWGILTLFVLLGIYYSLALPIFEAADEVSHFRVIEFMADNGSIPHIVDDAEQVGHESLSLIHI